MLKINELGFLEPNKAIPSDINELEKYFVIEYSSVDRSKLFEEYLRYSKDLKRKCGNIELQHWINGSFVSLNKLRPNDIDMVTFIDTSTFQKLGKELQPFIYPNSKINYPGIDAYIIEIKSTVIEYDKTYWHHQFSTSRRNKRTGKKLSKGYLEIIY